MTIVDTDSILTLMTVEVMTVTSESRAGDAVAPNLGKKTHLNCHPCFQMEIPSLQ